MNLNQIHKIELDGQIESAAKHYEEWLEEYPDDHHSVVDLAVLYWCVTDYGLHSGLKLPMDFVKLASSRSRVLLDDCISKTGDPEATFWRMYFDYMDWGREIDEDVKQLLKNSPNCLTPLVFLVLNKVEPIGSEKVSKLRASLIGSGPTKVKYITSVLDSCSW
ncbi:hypothetical protein [Mesoterricola sediminis]|uniref:hypothetical protein n=1 Tax=Mesoterricola sediminis TaxID=2927980 RepID=UPI0029316E8E|nr:hypothetical protein [Mesoterricola sediminis]